MTDDPELRARIEQSLMSVIERWDVGGGGMSRQIDMALPDMIDAILSAFADEARQCAEVRQKLAALLARIDELLLRPHHEAKHWCVSHHDLRRAVDGDTPTPQADSQQPRDGRPATPADEIRAAGRALTRTPLPGGPWTVTENALGDPNYEDRVWDPDAWWVTAPNEPFETQTIVLAYGESVARHIAMLAASRDLGRLLLAVADETDAMSLAVEHLVATDPLAAQRLRQGPRTFDPALKVARAVLGTDPATTTEEA